MATDLARRGARTVFACTACSAQAPRWSGRCPECEAWNTLEETAAPIVGLRPAATGSPQTVSLGSVMATRAVRHPSGSTEVDRVLGGGLVPGSVVLLGGDPGIGKSTLALQVARHAGGGATPALYCTGEESAEQLALRAGRLGSVGDEVSVLVESDVDTVVSAIGGVRPPLAVVDSVQTLRDRAVPGAPGSASQVRAAVLRMAEIAKSTGVAVLLVGHVTKEGAIAGPRTLEHMVDVVLFLEGERLGDHRMLRGIKNRFGATGEVGLLAMERSGMRDVDAAGRGLLDGASLGGAGSVLTVTTEGVRPMAVEIQALVAPSPFEFPRRTASGFDLNRLHLLLAVLGKRAGVALGRSDVFVNVAGGVRLGDPATDLAVALAVAGSARDRRVSRSTAVIGELGLGGEVRGVARTEARLGEAAAVGMDTVVLPAGHRGATLAGLGCRRVATLAEAVALLS